MRIFFPVLFIDQYILPSIKIVAQQERTTIFYIHTAGGRQTISLMCLILFMLLHKPNVVIAFSIMDLLCLCNFDLASGDKNKPCPQSNHRRHHERDMVKTWIIYSELLLSRSKGTYMIT